MDELREKIAKSLAGWDGWNWEMMAETEELAGSDEIGKDSYYKMADRIHALYKEAGYLSHEEIQSMLNTLSGGFAEIAKIAGYVRLSQDQIT